MPNRAPRKLPFLNSSFLAFLLGTLLLFAAVIGTAYAYIVWQLPDDYRIRLSIEPKEKSTDPRFVYNLVIHPSRDENETLDLTALLVKGNFPDLALIDEWVTLGGEPVVIEPNRPKVVTVGRRFCLYCLDLYPYMRVLENRYRDAQILAVLYAKYENELDKEVILQYMRDHAFTFPIGLDTNQDFIDQLHINLVPMTYVLDRNGKVVYAKQGVDNFDEIEKYLKAAIATE